MIADELFKKLRPILGDKLSPLETVYIAGDAFSKRSVEQILRLVYANVATGISPPPLSLCAGNYPLGTVLCGNKELFPFALREADWFHIGIFGQTGRGKTNTMLHLVQILRKQKIPWLVFDFKRTGYRSLVSIDDSINVFTVGRDISPFYFNPLISPQGVDSITWYKQLIQCLSHAYFLGHGCEVILQEVLGPKTGQLVDVLQALEIYSARSRKLQWLQSTQRAIKALCYGGIGRVLNVENAPRIHHWLDKNVVFELDALTESEAKFFVNVIMSAIYSHRKEAGESGFLHVSVIEEAHNVLKKENANVEAKSVMDKIFREIREYGESLIIIDQMPSTLLDSAFANTATQITFSLKHHRDVSACGKSMLLDCDEQTFLGKLPIGIALVKLQNRWHAPFFLKMPLAGEKTAKITDDVLKARITGDFAVSGQISPEIRKREEISVLWETDKEMKKLLKSIVDQPFIGMAQRYRQLGINPRSGNECQLKLVKLGLVKAVNVPIGKSRLKLMELTEKGKQKIRAPGISDQTRSQRHGGIQHLYWVYQIKHLLDKAGYYVCEEFPIGNGQTVDLVIHRSHAKPVTRDKQIAVEIETGKSDARRNISKCLSAGFSGVISLATNKDAFKQIQSIAEPFDATQRKKIRISCAWKIKAFSRSS